MRFVRFTLLSLVGNKNIYSKLYGANPWPDACVFTVKQDEYMLLLIAITGHTLIELYIRDMSIRVAGVPPNP